MASHIDIGGLSPGTDEGATAIRSPSPMIASARGTSSAAFACTSFWAITRVAITDIQVTLITPSATITEHLHIGKASHLLRRLLREDVEGRFLLSAAEVRDRDRAARAFEAACAAGD